MGWQGYSNLAGANEAAPVHDGPLHGHAANDDGQHDAAPAVHVAKVRDVVGLGALACFAEPPLL